MGEHGRHLGAASVVHTDEEDRGHCSLNQSIHLRSRHQPLAGEAMNEHRNEFDEFSVPKLVQQFVGALGYGFAKVASSPAAWQSRRGTTSIHRLSHHRATIELVSPTTLFSLAFAVVLVAMSAVPMTTSFRPDGLVDAGHRLEQLQGEPHDGQHHDIPNTAASAASVLTSPVHFQGETGSSSFPASADESVLFAGATVSPLVGPPRLAAT